MNPVKSCQKSREAGVYLVEVIDGDQFRREAAVHTEEAPIDEGGDGERTE